MDGTHAELIAVPGRRTSTRCRDGDLVRGGGGVPARLRDRLPDARDAGAAARGRVGAALGDRQRRRDGGARDRQGARRAGARHLVERREARARAGARRRRDRQPRRPATCVAAVAEATGGRASTSSSSTSARRPGRRSLQAAASGRPHRRLRRDQRARTRRRSPAPDLVEAADDLRLDDGHARGLRRRPTSSSRAAAREPVVDSVFPLAEARAAHERLEAGEQFGKIVLTIP